MALRYFNGFGLNYAIGPLSGSPSDNVNGYWDFNSHFGHSTLDFNYPVVPTVEEGNRQRLRMGSQNSPFGAAALRSIGYPFSQNICRVGFEISGSLPASKRAIFGIGFSRYLQITVSPTGVLEAYDSPDNSEDGWASGTLLGNLVATFSPSIPNRIEVFMNRPTGAVSIKINGITRLTTTMTPQAGSASLLFGWPQPGAFGTGHIWDITNVWSTDGEELVEGINGVQVEAAIDSYETILTAGLRGSLIIGDDQYQTDWQGSAISSLLATADWVKNKNVANIHHFLYRTNPSNSLQWEEADLGFRWGVCYHADAFNSTIRLAGLALSIFRVTDGVPNVTYHRPGSVTFFSGPWVKAKPERTFSANINSMPRENILQRDDAGSLYINGEGCIFFDTFQDTEDEPLGTIGITFAEEFRTDYRDWVRVTGTGFPFDSYFIAGYGVYGEGNRQFQNNYVTVNYRNVPTGGAYIQGLWDYSFDPDNGRWSMRQQVYHNSEGQTHGMRKLKIRGHGKALQIRVVNDGDKPFDINGWSLLITSNTAV